MYGPDEHREALRRIRVVAQDANELRKGLTYARAHLHEDDANGTADAREHLRAASLLLSRVEKACDEARDALPTPAARPDYPAAYDALHEGHR